MAADTLSEFGRCKAEKMSGQLPVQFARVSLYAGLRCGQRPEIDGELLAREFDCCVQVRVQRKDGGSMAL